MGSTHPKNQAQKIPGTHGPVELRLADEPSHASQPGLGGWVVARILRHPVSELGAWQNPGRSAWQNPVKGPGLVKNSDHMEKG